MVPWDLFSIFPSQVQLTRNQTTSRLVLIDVMRLDHEGFTQLRCFSFKVIYSSMRYIAVMPPECSLVWNDEGTIGGMFFVRYFLGLSGETKTTIKFTSLVLYPVHCVFMCCSAKHLRWLVDNGRRVDCILPVGLGSGFKGNCSFYEVQTFVYCFSARDEFHAQKILRFPSQRNA